jgi:uncharacterized protein YrrD
MASPDLYPGAVDLGAQISYQVLERGSDVLSSDGTKVGTVAHVLADPATDIFDGIVIAEHLGLIGHRFVDADQVAEIHTGGVLLKLDRQAAEQLPEPSANPAVMHDDPGEPGSGVLGEKLRRAWDYISGNY